MNIPSSSSISSNSTAQPPIDRLSFHREIAPLDLPEVFRINKLGTKYQRDLTYYQQAETAVKVRAAWARLKDQIGDRTGENVVAFSVYLKSGDVTYLTSDGERHTTLNLLRDCAEDLQALNDLRATANKEDYPVDHWHDKYDLFLKNELEYLRSQTKNHFWQISRPVVDGPEREQVDARIKKYNLEKLARESLARDAAVNRNSMTSHSSQHSAHSTSPAPEECASKVQDYIFTHIDELTLEEIEVLETFTDEEMEIYDTTERQQGVTIKEYRELLDELAAP